MLRKYFINSTVLILFLLMLLGCSTTEYAQNEQAKKSNADLEALFWQRIEQSRSNFSPADVDFMIGMIGHHAQALVMSSLADQNSNRRDIKTLAARITNAQTDEIWLMQQWLRDRNQIVPEYSINGIELTVRGGAHTINHRNMPGVLTDSQLRELRDAQGADFDRMYLTFMIQHHEGAVYMVRELFAQDGAALDEEVFRLASDIHVEQITEIERMQSMLDAMAASN